MDGGGYVVGDDVKVTIELELIARHDDKDGLRDGLCIEAAAWKAKAGTAILSQPDLVQFYTQIAENFGHLGILRSQWDGFPLLPYRRTSLCRRLPERREARGHARPALFN